MVFDSKQFQYKDIKMTIDGEEIVGFTSVRFKPSRDKEYLRGRGDQPHEIQHGNLEYEGEVGLWQSTVEQLMAKSPGGDITLFRGELIVMFAQTETDKISGYRLTAMEFDEADMGMSQGDKSMEIKLPIKFLGLKKVA